MPIPRPPASALMAKFGLAPDPWQLDALEGNHPRLLLNCSRQAGKSTVAAVMALVEALFEPMAKILLLSRSMRQAAELFRTVNFLHYLLRERLKAKRTATELTLQNLSRIVCLPCREDTIRGFSSINLIIIDEAARVPDNLYRAVRPMLAVSGGRMVCMSTPFGRRGFFWREWARGGDDWRRIEIPATQVSRIKPEFLEAERRSLGDAWFRQEYLCSFEAQEGLVYPDFRRCLVESLPVHVLAPPQAPGRAYVTPGVSPDGAQWLGGLDFGFRNPFAAVWGAQDRDGVLWITSEHYAAQQPLSYHAQRLPREVVWYADPAGAGDIAELRRANFLIKRGRNDIRPGIAAVTARLREDRLKVVRPNCPNLLREADLYRYPSTNAANPAEEDGPTGENPIDAHNHALAALRYLIARIDQNRQVPVGLPGFVEEATNLEEERYWR